MAISPHRTNGDLSGVLEFAVKRVKKNDAKRCKTGPKVDKSLDKLFGDRVRVKYRKFFNQVKKIEVFK